MTQATPPSPLSSPVPAADELIARYQAAQATLDAESGTATAPSPAVRANVLAYAQQLAKSRLADARPAGKAAPGAADAVDVAALDTSSTINSIATQAVNTWTTGSFEHKKPASNDSQWKIKAFASIAVFGLGSLLFVQWQSASPDEQDAAFSVQRPAPAAPYVPAPPPAAAAAVPTPKPETKAQDKASAKAQAATTPTATQRAAPSASAQSISKPEAEVSVSNAPQNESLSAGPAPEPASAAAPAPAQARARAAGAANTADKSAVDHLAADAATADRAASGVQPFAPSSPLVAAASVNSALFSAIRSKNRSALQAALNNGADKNAKDNGTPAITLCVQTGQMDLLRLLLVAGADVNAPDAQGISALDHARGRDAQEIMALLMQYGAK